MRETIIPIATLSPGNNHLVPAVHTPGDVSRCGLAVRRLLVCVVLASGV